MSDYIFSQKAVDDLSSIWNYSAEQWSEVQADRYYSMLISCCKDLAEKKLKGSKYFNLGTDILGLPTSNHIIFYRVISNCKIEILRILHQKMDYKSHFF